MSKCPGLHCPGCGDGDGGIGALIAVLVALAIVAAVLHAIWHIIVEAAEIAALAVVSAAGLAAVAGLGYAALRIRARVTSSRARQVIPAPIQVIRLDPPIRDAIEAPAPRPASWPLPGRWEQITSDTDRNAS
jgi:hypothetical protein